MPGTGPFHFDIPEGTRSIQLSTPQIRNLSIPSTLEQIWMYGYASVNNAFETIICSDENPRMKAIDNVLYTKDGTELLLYPSANRAVAFVLPEGVERFDIRSEYLEHLTIPEGMDDIYGYTLNAKNLKSLTLPSTLEAVPINPYDHVPNLQAVIIPDANPYMKSIGGCVYSADGETLLFVPPGKEALIIAEGTRHIKDIDDDWYIYRGGESVQTFFIPATMTDFNPSIFYLRFYNEDAPMYPPTAYSVAKKHPTMMAKDGMLLSKDGKTLIAAPLIRRETFEIPAGIEHIGEYAFPQNDTLNVVVIPEGVVTIGERAFAGQTSLTAVSLPSTVKSIAEGAFEDCLRLAKIVLPGGMTSLEYIIPFSEALAYDWEMSSAKPQVTRIEMVIPPSVTAFDERYGESCHVNRHGSEYMWVVAKNSAAHRYALEYGVPYRCIDDEMDVSEAVYGMLVVADAEGSIPLYAAMDERSPHTARDQGSMVFIAQQFADWAKVLVDQGVGFVKNENLHVLDRSIDINDYAAVATDALPAYAFPSEAAGVVYTFPPGAEVFVLSSAGPWLRILTENGVGFVWMGPENALDWVDKEYAIVSMMETAHQSVPVYATPEITGKVLRQCFPGEILRIDTAGVDWCMVSGGCGGARNGFIQTERLTFAQIRRP